MTGGATRRARTSGEATRKKRVPAAGGGSRRDEKGKEKRLRITAFGIPSKKIELDWANDLIFKGVRVHGIVGREIFETWYKADRLLRSGAIDLKPVVTHTFPLKDFEAGFAAMTAPARDCGKVVFVP